MRTTIITEVSIPSVITEVEAGPQGPPGHIALASRLDTALSPLLYAGEALPGSMEEEAVWRIWRVNIAAGSVKEWAGGVATFANRWIDRLDLSYL